MLKETVNTSNISSNTQLTLQEFVDSKYQEIIPYLKEETLIINSEKIYASQGEFLLSLKFPEGETCKVDISYLVQGESITPLTKGGGENSTGTWRSISCRINLAEAIASGYFAQEAIPKVLNWALGSSEKAGSLKLVLPEGGGFVGELYVTRQTERTKGMGRNASAVGTQINLAFGRVGFQGASVLAQNSGLLYESQNSGLSLAELAASYGIRAVARGAEALAVALPM